MELPNVMHFTQAIRDLVMLAWLSAGFSSTQAGGGKMGQVFGLWLSLGAARGPVSETRNPDLSITGLCPCIP